MSIEEQIQALGLTDVQAQTIWSIGVDVWNSLQKHDLRAIQTQDVAFELERTKWKLDLEHARLYASSLQEQLERVEKTLQASHEKQMNDSARLMDQQSVQIKDFQTRLVESEKQYQLRCQDLQRLLDESIQTRSQLVHEVEERWIKQQAEDRGHQRQVYEQHCVQLENHLKEMQAKLTRQEERAMEERTQWLEERNQWLEERKQWCARLDEMLQQTIRKQHASAAVRGQMGESDFQAYLAQFMPHHIVQDKHKTAGSGDFWVSDPAKTCCILIDVKQYTTAVPRNQIEKIMVDIDRHPDVHGGMLVSMTTSISGHTSFSYQYTPGGKPLLFFATMQDDPRMIEYAYRVVELLAIQGAQQDSNTPVLVEQIKTRIQSALLELARSASRVKTCREQAIALVQCVQESFREREQELRQLLWMIERKNLLDDSASSSASSSSASSSSASSSSASSSSNSDSSSLTFPSFESSVSPDASSMFSDAKQPKLKKRKVKAAENAS
jgi:hypothetical protein